MVACGLTIVAGALLIKEITGIDVMESNDSTAAQR